ncbi:FAD:protein FMN transferase [Selenomonas sp. AB3002]|uniref:FAD:protein FMN transferase n=1 Tax=Selenomonas sp. AB3002 TaxID=1392502 RepID=UPI00068AAF57
MVQKSEIVMDTVAQLTAEGTEAEAAVQESFVRLQELEGILSNYEEGSDAARLRDSAGSGAWVKVSPEMYHLLEISQRYSQLTDGAWDITAAPLVKLWGIGTDKARVPEPSEIEQARGKVDWHKLELDGRDSARLLVPGMELDMGGIAKGYALDEVRKIYAKHGIEKGLINLGTSSIYGLGMNKEGQPWRIGLRHPRRDDPKEYLKVEELSDEALSTSGDYERYFEEDGVRYHHIIDPRTGYPAWCGREVPAGERPVSIAVIIEGRDEDCGVKSDLLTTALFVLGKEKGAELLESLQAEGVRGEIVTEENL